MLRKRFENFQTEHPFDNLNETVYNTLYSSIIDLSLVPGSTLSETSIAEQMGISRTPVRNALIRLLEIGLVVQNKGQAFQVAEIQKHDCRELMEARLSIEAQCAYWAADRATEADLKELDKAMADYIKAFDLWDIDRMVDSDHRFHQAIVSAAHNATLMELYHNISPRVLHYRYYLFHQAGEAALRPIMGMSVRHHQAIYNAVNMGFSSAARECMEKDVSGMLDIVGNW